MNSKVIRIIILLITPFIIGLILFFPRNITLQPKPENNQTWIEIPNFKELNEKSGPGRMMRSIFSTPFDLRYYTLIIEDITFYNGSKGGLGYYIFLDNEKLDFLEAGGITKTTVLAETKPIIKTKLKISRGNAPLWSKVSFNMDFAISVRSNWYDVVAKLILILVA